MLSYDYKNDAFITQQLFCKNGALLRNNLLQRLYLIIIFGGMINPACRYVQDLKNILMVTFEERVIFKEGLCFAIFALTSQKVPSFF